ncbi:MAG: hypothetical protein AABO58_05040 [Acidobacteriota bacterium]
MRIVNRSNDSVDWWVYNDNDDAPKLFKWNRAKGSVGAGGVNEWTYDRGELLLQIHKKGQELMEPKRLKTGVTVIVTNSNAVPLSDDQEALIGYAERVGVDAHTFNAGPIAALGLTILKAAAGAIPVVGSAISAGATAVADWLKGGLTLEMLNRLPSLATMQAMQQKLIDQNEARKAAASILTAWEWYEPYVRKGLDAASKKMQLSDLDSRRFREGLDRFLGADSALLNNLRFLEENAGVRKHTLPAFINGVALRMDFERIDLAYRAQMKSLTRVDVVRLVDVAQRYRSAIESTNRDLEIEGLNMIHNSNLGGTPEFTKLRDGYVARYWMGDTGIGTMARGSLDMLVQQLRELERTI